MDFEAMIVWTSSFQSSTASWSSTHNSARVEISCRHNKQPEFEHLTEVY